jgi:hypothetical protein
MSTPVNPSNPKPAGDNRNLVAVDPNYPAVTVEDKLHKWWQQNRTMLIVVCAAVIVGFLVKAGWESMAAKKEREIEDAFAKLTLTEQLKSFAAEHPNHSLAGVAYVRIADEAYIAGKPAEAVTSYDQALAVIKEGPLAARIRLGRALAKVQAGKASEGTAELTQLANDTNQLNVVRAEAAYQLASLAAEAGNAADVQKYSTQLMQIDPSSVWTQRALVLRANFPAASAPTEAPLAPAANDGKKDTPASGTPITLPK